VPAVFAHRASRRLAGVALALALIGAGVGVAMAVDPPYGGPFTGCLAAKTTTGTPATKGLIYNVAKSATSPLAPCVKGDTMISFSDGEGLKGDKGDPGEPGPSGVPGASGAPGAPGGIASVAALDGTDCDVAGVTSTLMVTTNAANGAVTLNCGAALTVTSVNGVYTRTEDVVIDGEVIAGVPADSPGVFGCGWHYVPALPCTAILTPGGEATVTLTGSTLLPAFIVTCPDGTIATTEDRDSYWFAQCTFTMDSNKTVTLAYS
jgi:hypothetical protein